MKLAEFNELCAREWAGHGTADFRDVIGLRLTGPGAAELAADVFGDGSGTDFPEGKPSGAVGVAVDHVVNPVTRSVVKVEVGEGPQTVTVQRGPEVLTTPLG